MLPDTEKTIADLRVTRRIARVYRLGVRRISRAHLALTRRPELCEQFRSALARTTEALSAQLACEVSAEARLLPSIASPERQLSAEAALVLIELDAIGASAVLELERPVLCAALERLSGGPGRAGPSSKLTRIEQAAFGFLALVALSGIRAEPQVEALLAPRLRRANAAREDALEALDRSPCLSLQLTLRIAEVEGQARLFVPCRALQTVAEEAPLPPPGTIPSEILQAALPIRVFAHATALTPDDLRALRAGDVVLCDGLQLDADQVHGTARLSAPAFELLGQFVAEGFTVDRAHPRSHSQESSMSEPAQNDSLPPLPVDVEVELTRLRLPLAELAELKPGQLLQLHINASEPVTLRVGDRAIARAELVEIEGEVGARILSLIA